MTSVLSLFLRKAFTPYVKKLRNSAVRLLDKMADRSTCIKVEDISSEDFPQTTENSGGLKRSLHDDVKIEEDGANKKLKTELEEKSAEDGKLVENAGSLPKARRKKCALLLSYCGAGYNGMQINPGVRTIEDELVTALFKAEAITEDGKNNFGKMAFQRCARTDKDESILPKINEHLPPEIRVIAIKRTTRGFDAKSNCSGRTYKYLAPTFAFAKDYQTTSDYRITEEKLEEVNSILSKFIGTHNYHNFTSGKKFNDASAQRYIMKFECREPFEKDGREFITFTVKGQSFMLHQIRKMIGLTLAISRGVAPASTIELAWQEKKVDIPRAPPVGLFLDKLHFDAYDRRYGDDGIHEAIQWDENEEEIQQFKDKYIYKHITDTEAREHVMMKWLKTLTEHTYTDERMEEIHSKEDEKTATRLAETSKDTDNTEHSTNDLSCTGEGTEQVSDSVEKKQQFETKDNVDWM